MTITHLANCKYWVIHGSTLLLVAALGVAALGQRVALAATGPAVANHQSRAATLPPGDGSPGDPGVPGTIVPGPTGFFVPPVVEGDAEFSGRSVDFHAVVTLEIRNDREIWAVVRLEGKERGGDGTVIRGEKAYLVRRAEGPIHEIVGPTRWEGWYRDRDQAVNAIRGGGLVTSWVCTGDQGTGDAGVTSGCQFFLAPVQVR